MFKIIVIIFLIVELIEVVSSFLYKYTPIALLFPVLLYSMVFLIHKENMRLSKYWYLLLPFLLFTGLYIFLFFISSDQDAVADWIRYYVNFYVFYLLVYVILIFISCHNTRNPEMESEYFLVKQLNLLLAIHLGVVASLVYMKAPVETPNILFERSKIWALLLFLFAGALLKIHYLYKTLKNKDDKQLVEFVTENELQEHKKILVDLFEKKKIYLIHELDKDMLSKESGISKSELNYFFKKYIEADFRVFVAGYRIRHALELLEKNGVLYTLESIAQQSGYRSVGTFTKYFTLFTSISPSKYLSKKRTKVINKREEVY